MKTNTTPDALVRASLIWVASLSFLYFVFEFIFAIYIQSVALLADSLDFLEDSFITLLILLSLRWSASTRGRIGRLFAILILVPAMWTVIEALQKIQDPRQPEVYSMMIASVGAGVMNLICAGIVLRIKNLGTPMVKDAWIISRNDLTVNVAIIVMGLITAFWIQNGWPDIVLGLGIFLLSVSAAWNIWKTAHLEKISEPVNLLLK